MPPTNAKSILNQTLLAGLTYLDENGDVAEQVQIFGEIVAVDDQTNPLPTITLVTPEREEWRLPIHYSSLMVAPRGEYRLLAAEEQVRDPDLIANWTIYPSSDPDNPGDWKPNYSPFHNDNSPSCTASKRYTGS